MSYRSSNFYSPKNILSAAAVTALYLFVSYLLIGYKTDQLVLAGIFNVFYFAHPVARKFILGFSIFIVYWIIFDYMKAFPNYRFNTVHITDLYNHEKALFGIGSGEARVTPNEFWKAHQSSVLDVMTGIFYLCWIPVPLAFAAYLFFKNKPLFLQFSITFVLVNMIGFIIYYIYPAAPPWYLQQYGKDFIAGTPGNTAGLARFDQFFNVSIFKNLYAKGSNVFAAMPSLHSSYPLIVVYYEFRNRVWLPVRLVFIAVMLGIWFAAVYTSHHYVLDVLAGITCAITGIIIFQKGMLRSGWFRQLLHKYLQFIS